MVPEFDTHRPYVFLKIMAGTWNRNGNLINVSDERFPSDLCNCPHFFSFLTIIELAVDLSLEVEVYFQFRC